MLAYSTRFVPSPSHEHAVVRIPNNVGINMTNMVEQELLKISDFNRVTDSSEELNMYYMHDMFYEEIMDMLMELVNEFPLLEDRIYLDLE